MSAQEILEAALELSPEERALITDELLMRIVPANISPSESKLYLAIKLFEKGRATLGQAATVAGCTKGEFMDILAKEQIPISNYSTEDLEKELQEEIERRAGAFERGEFKMVPAEEVFQALRK